MLCRGRSVLTSTGRRRPTSPHWDLPESASSDLGGLHPECPMSAV